MNPPLSASLLSITAHARSGALDHAWRLFRDAGLESVSDDPAVLGVRGRLLKDRADGSEGEARRRFLLQAADAYARAASLSGATYPLINAASLSLLAGDASASQRLAVDTLARLDTGPDQAETPYYLAATRAEALLLLGRTAEARATLEGAVALAPRAWEDHASTLRQFARILTALGQDAGWLDALRPPRALHFAGHMAVSPHDDEAVRAVAEVVAAERIGFGYGALAAGADILVAEALLAAGAELHVVLPAQRDSFREASVAVADPGWAARFDAVIARADTVETVARAAEGPHLPAIRLAAEVAMGRAVMQASRLATEAVQLLLLDDPAATGGSGAFGLGWRAAGRRQRVLAVARATGGPPATASIDRGERLAAMIAIEVSGLDGAEGADLARTLAAAVGSGAEPRWNGSTLGLTYETPGTAAMAALAAAGALAGRADVRIGGHYGLVRRIDDPFGGPPLAVGGEASIAAMLLASTPPGAVHVTEAFAAALYAGATPGVRAEHIGDLSGVDPEQPTRLFSLRT